VAKRPAKSRLYTRTGDRGQTGLFGGRRVAKDHARVQAYGTIDELNSAIGVACTAVRQRRLVADLQSIQNELFNIGAELSSAQPVRKAARQTSAFQLSNASVERLEALTDAYDAKAPPLTTFILPGGSAGAAQLHLARTVARRAERAVVTLDRKERINPLVLAYLNRLCDLLFAMGRYANRADRKRELLWTKD
jgi:cob(I)alamin adenosyltransferase